MTVEKTWSVPAFALLPASQAAKALLLFLLFLSALSAQADQSGDFIYTTDGTSVTITGYTGTGGVVDIPGTITNLPVVSIGDYAFQNSTSLTSVTIPNSVLTLGTYAFNTCSGLTNIVIGTNVASFGDVAFGGCSQLKSIFVPDSVTNLGRAAFEFCPGLTSASIGGQVASLDWATFYSCTGLTNVVIGAGVTNLGDQAFYNCPSLTGIYFKGNGPGYGTNVFQGDNSAIVFYQPGTTNWSSTFDGLPAFELAPFNYTTSNATVTLTGYTGTNIVMTIPGTLYGMPVVSIGDVAFQHLTNLTSVTIPDSVTNIGASAFSACTSLANVVIGTNVISIGDYAFFHCSSLGSVAVPSSVINIGSAAFTLCARLNDFTVDTANPAFSSVDGVLFDKHQTTLIQCPPTKAGAYAIPNTVTNIGPNAFAYCSGLTGITIPPGVTTIGSQTFAGCTSLGSITMPDSVTSLGDYAFQTCYGLTNVTLSANIATIGNFAFYGCGMSSITIPVSVTNLGNSAFNSCYALRGIYFTGSAPGLGANVFGLDNNLTVYYLAGTAGWGPTFSGWPTALWTPPTQTKDAAPGVVAFYTFDGSLTDSTTNHNDLKVTAGNGVSYAPGRFGSALYVDGSITLGTVSGAFPVGVPTGTAPYTVAAWVKADTGCPLTGGWIGYGNNATSQGNNFRLNGVPDGVWEYWYNNDFGATLPSGNFFDGFHSVIGTWDGTNEILYLDGVATQRTPGPTGLNIGTGTFVVGKTTADVNFKGWIDNLMILNRAITPTEVAAYQANGAVAYVSPIPAEIKNAVRQSNGPFQFGFTNTAYSSFTVFASTNLASSFNTWSNLGPALETPAGSGQYQFTDPEATNSAHRFYRVRSP